MSDEGMTKQPEELPTDLPALHAKIKEAEQLKGEVDENIRRYRQAFQKELSKLGARPSSEDVIRPLRERVEQPAAVSRPQVIVKRTSPWWIWICLASSVGSLLMSFIQPIVIEPSKIPPWILILSVAAVALFFAVIFLVGCISVAGIYLSLKVLQQPAAAPAMVAEPVQPVDRMPWDLPFHAEPLEKSVPIENGIQRKSGSLEQDPEYKIYLEAIERGEIAPEDNFASFSERRTNGLDPFAV